MIKTPERKRVSDQSCATFPLLCCVIAFFEVFSGLIMNDYFNQPGSGACKPAGSIGKEKATSQGVSSSALPVSVIQWKGFKIGFLCAAESLCAHVFSVVGSIISGSELIL